MPEPDQVLGGEPTRVGLTHIDVAAAARHAAIDEDVRHPAAGHELENRVAGGGAGHHDPVDPALLDEPIPGLLGHSAVVLGEHDHVPAAVGLGDRAPDDV